MGPGPSNPYPEVMAAFARPVLGHLDPEFLALLDATNERLRQVFATTNALTLPVSGTGSAGMEAAFVNFVRPGDPVVVGVNGVFGQRMCDVAERVGGGGDQGRRSVGAADRARGASLGPPESLDHRGGARRDVDRRAQRDCAVGSGEGGRPPPGGHGDLVGGNLRGGR